jgi:hypothetical protein
MMVSLPQVYFVFVCPSSLILAKYHYPSIITAMNRLLAIGEVAESLAGSGTYLNRPSSA